MFEEKDFIVVRNLKRNASELPKVFKDAQTDTNEVQPI